MSELSFYANFITASICLMLIGLIILSDDTEGDDEQ